MSPHVVTETRESLLERRAQILAALGMSEDDFIAFAGSNTLTGEEFEAREELAEIRFLLGE